jgi:hypothetical protein
VDNIRMDLREIGWKGVDSSGSGYGQVVGFCKYGNETSGSRKHGEFD